jgi:hypothetical protein
MPAGPRPDPGPSPASGIVKIAAGAFAGLFLVVMYLQQSHAGYGIAFGLALVLGVAIRGIAVGGANVVKKKIPLLPSLGIALGVAVLGALAGPTLSEAFCRSDEESTWEKVTGLESGSSFRAETWKTEYEEKVDPKFRRPEWKGRFMLARVKDAVRDKRQADLRDILREISAVPAGEQALYTAARDEAAKAFRSYYDQAKGKMFAAPSGGSGKPREFPVDENLRRAFVELFDDLARSPDANVYVAFANAVKLDAPKGTDVELAFMRRQPDALAAFPKGDAPVIQPGQAFSPAFDTRRRQTFMTALAESFGQVFDAELLTLVPLEAGADRTGKIVFEVSSAISRTNDFYVYTNTDDATGQKQFIGFLFGIYVDWSFRIVDRSGKALYEPKPTRSHPADNIRVERGDNDPEYAMYSVMMDSAYYNYSREITGKFGLTPPPIRESFAYQGGK